MTYEGKYSRRDAKKAPEYHKLAHGSLLFNVVLQLYFNLFALCRLVYPCHSVGSCNGRGVAAVTSLHGNVAGVSAGVELFQLNLPKLARNGGGKRERIITGRNKAEHSSVTIRAKSALSAAR